MENGRVRLVKCLWLYDNLSGGFFLCLFWPWLLLLSCFPWHAEHWSLRWCWTTEKDTLRWVTSRRVGPSGTQLNTSRQWLSPPVQQMKRLGQTHLAHMLTLSLTHFVCGPPLFPEPCPYLSFCCGVPASDRSPPSLPPGIPPLSLPSPSLLSNATSLPFYSQHSPYKAHCPLVHGEAQSHGTSGASANDRTAKAFPVGCWAVSFAALGAKWNVSFFYLGGLFSFFFPSFRWSKERCIPEAALWKERHLF